MSAALDKLSTRERFLNSQCEHLTAEYRDAKEQLSEVQMLFSQKQDIAAELDSELTSVVKVCILLHLATLAYNVKRHACLLSGSNMSGYPSLPCAKVYTLPKADAFSYQVPQGNATCGSTCKSYVQST